jgi:DNA mismatch repair ATPase MutS
MYDNYHFCEQIKENDIVFEYKIHEGPSKSKNAIRLLEYVNFPAEIIVNAKRNCQP